MARRNYTNQTVSHKQARAHPLIAPHLYHWKSVDVGCVDPCYWYELTSEM